MPVHGFTETPVVSLPHERVMVLRRSGSAIARCTGLRASTQRLQQPHVGEGQHGLFGAQPQIVSYGLGVGAAQQVQPLLHGFNVLKTGARAYL